MRETRAAVRAHRDQIDLVLDGELDDFVLGLADADERRDGDTVFCDPRGQIGEVLLGLLDRVVLDVDRRTALVRHDHRLGFEPAGQIDDVQQDHFRVVRFRFIARDGNGVIR